MNNIVQSISREWERNVLLLLAAVVAGIGGYYAYLYLNSEEEGEMRSKSKPELPRYYDVALLDGTVVTGIESGVNPMSCEFSKPAPPPRKPFKPPVIPRIPQPEPPVKPQPAKPPVKPQPSKPQPSKPQVKPQPAKPKPQPPKPKPKPRPKRKRKFEFTYVGNMSISGGSSAAQLWAAEILSKRQRNRFKARLQVGGKLFGGVFEIAEFDKNRVVLKHSGDKKVVVQLRAKKRVIEIEVED